MGNAHLRTPSARRTPVLEGRGEAQAKEGRLREDASRHARRRAYGRPETALRRARGRPKPRRQQKPRTKTDEREETTAAPPPRASEDAKNPLRRARDAKTRPPRLGTPRYARSTATGRAAFHASLLRCGGAERRLRCTSPATPGTCGHLLDSHGYPARRRASRATPAKAAAPAASGKRARTR